MFTISLFGHSFVFNYGEVYKNLYALITSVAPLTQSVKFCVGRHGNFDELALKVCKSIKKNYPHIKICVAFNSQADIKKQQLDNELYFNGIEPVIYDTSSAHYKNKITKQNELMVEESDIVICYINPTYKKSGALNAIKYAKKLNKKIYNCFIDNNNNNKTCYYFIL